MPEQAGHKRENKLKFFFILKQHKYSENFMYLSFFIFLFFFIPKLKYLYIYILYRKSSPILPHVMYNTKRVVTFFKFINL